MSNPKIKHLPGQSPLAKEMGLSKRYRLVSLFAPYGRTFARQKHDAHGLQQFLRFRIAFTRQALDRESWFGGRLWNKLIGEDPHFVWMYGAHLKQTLALLDIEAPDNIIASKQYSLDLETTERALNVLNRQLAGTDTPD